jgi:hypothetical protein
VPGVLVRSEGRGENPGCAGQPSDVTDSGGPILEVDHVRDIALGGAGKPRQMIALCPNCHAVKTRGRTREQLSQTLLATAEKRRGCSLEQADAHEPGKAQASAGAGSLRTDGADRQSDRQKVFSCVIGPRLAALYRLRSETPKCQFMWLQFGCGRDAAQDA